MPVNELERWRLAQQLIQNHGDDADIEAAQWAHRAIDKGDPEGETIWMDVWGKVCALQGKTQGRLN